MGLFHAIITLILLLLLCFQMITSHQDWLCKLPTWKFKRIVVKLFKKHIFSIQIPQIIDFTNRLTFLFMLDVFGLISTRVSLQL